MSMKSKAALMMTLAVMIGACGGDDAPADTARTPDAAPPAAASDAPVVLADGTTAEMVEEGRQLFRGTANCHACHAQDATGTALAPSLRDQDWLNSDGSYDGIMQVIRNGVPRPVQYPAAMPPMGGVNLTDEQIRSVGAYVYSISHEG
jgi:mono/diheme cytochrome c family protein